MTHKDRSHYGRPMRDPADNFRYIGDLTPEREVWWLCYGAALVLAHLDWDGRDSGRRD